MSEADKGADARLAQREEAIALRRAHFEQTWREIKCEDPFAEFTFRRMFSIEILVNMPDLNPRAACFLGQACVDRNSFTPKQKAWLFSLVEEFLEPAPPKTEKPTKKQEAGK